jgi:hypothetical protein
MTNWCIRPQTVHRAIMRLGRNPALHACSIKTGGCPEDCGYCSQSRWKADSGVEATKLMDVQAVLQKAAQAADAGSQPFLHGCGVAQPQGPRHARDCRDREGRAADGHGNLHDAGHADARPGGDMLAEAGSIITTTTSTPRPSVIRKILIANRGEIACRVIKTARRMGIATVAVYSDADRDALHVQMADEAVHIGPPPARSPICSRQDHRGGKQTGAEAVHPGYGFLSENDQLCQARWRRRASPSSARRPHAIAAMGDKIESKKLAKEAGVNVVPGYVGEIETPSRRCASPTRSAIR